MLADDKPPVILSQSWTRSRRSLPTEYSLSKETVNDNMPDICPTVVQAPTSHGDSDVLLKKSDYMDVDNITIDDHEAKEDCNMEDCNDEQTDDTKIQVKKGNSYDTFIGKESLMKKRRSDDFESSWRQKESSWKQDESSQSAVKRKMSRSDSLGKGMKLAKFGSSRQVKQILSSRFYRL